jgi:hypothetical protein
MGEQRVRANDPGFRVIEEAELTDRYGASVLDLLIDHLHSTKTSKPSKTSRHAP